MTLFRGFGDDLPLMEWLEQKIWPAEARLTDDDVYWGTRLACVEMIRTGTVRFWDMYWRAGARWRAPSTTRGSGPRSGPPLLDGLDRRAARQRCGEAAPTRSTRSPSIAPGHAALAPHAIYTVSERIARAGSPSSPPTRDVPVHIHFLETEDEVTGCIAAHGVRPACIPRPARRARRADGPRPRRLDGRRGARAGRGPRRDGRDQPGRPT